MTDLAVAILAAGAGTRMKSAIPKVLHPVGGRSMILHVLDLVCSLAPAKLVLIVGHGREEVTQHITAAKLQLAVEYAVQSEQLGTGHALAQTKAQLQGHQGPVLVLSGDVPLLTKETVEQLYAHYKSRGAAAAVLSAHMASPFGYGRILRDDTGHFAGIVEERDASPEQQQITEINSGIYLFDSSRLYEALAKLSPDNSQGEYYLTDVLSLLAACGHQITAIAGSDPIEIQGVNNRVDQERLTAALRNRTLDRMMMAGVTIIDRQSTYIDHQVKIAEDVIIEPQTYLKGTTRIGARAHIGPGCYLEDAEVGADCRVTLSHLIGCKMAAKVMVGPFANLRPGTCLETEVKIGNFVELKNSHLHQGSKVSHLSYVGDADIGKNVNIGAGTITCNYDGQHKYRTEVAEGAFIGSNTSLIAPIKVGAGALIGAGSTINMDVPSGCLAVARGNQKNMLNRAKRFLEKE